MESSQSKVEEKELATQTPMQWYDKQINPDPTQDSESLNFTIQSNSNMTMSINNRVPALQNYQLPEQQPLMITDQSLEQQKLQQKFHFEQKKLAHKLLEFNSQNVKRDQQQNMDIKQLLEQTRMNNKQKIQEIVANETNVNLEDAIENLAKIEQYTSKMQGGEVKVRKGKNMRREIEKMSQDVMKREWSYDSGLVHRTPQGKRVMQTLYKESDGKDSLMLTSINKDTAMKFMSNRNSNKKPLRNSSVGFKTHQKDQQFLMSTLQPISFPDLQSKIQSAQPETKTQTIRDVNYINIFIQPHQETYEKFTEKHPKTSNSPETMEEPTQEQEDFLDQICNLIKNSPLYDILQKDQPTNKPSDESRSQSPIERRTQGSKFHKTFQEQMHQEDKRVQAKMLNEVLDRILTGKFYYKSKKMYEKMTEKDMRRGINGKYMQGLDFKQLLIEEAKKHLGHIEDDNYSTLEMLPVDEQIINEIFSIDKIKSFEKDIQKVLLQGDDLSDIVTFLTQEYYPELKQKHEDPLIKEFTDQKISNAISLKSITQKITDEKESRLQMKENIQRNSKLRMKLINKLLNKIGDSNQSIQEYEGMSNMAEATMSDQAVSLNQMIYLCFLELVRQLGSKCKEQGLLFIKIWHAYFDQVELQVQQMIKAIKTQTQKLHTNMEALNDTLQKFGQQLEEKDQKFVDMKINYEKTQHVLEIATKLLHKEEDNLKTGMTEYAKLSQSLKRIMPRYKEYMDDQPLLDQIVNASSMFVSKIDRKMYEQAKEKIDPYEEPLMMDLERVMNGLNTKMPSKVILENQIKKNSQLQKEVDDVNMAKFNLQVQFDHYKIQTHTQLEKVTQEKDACENEIAQLRTELAAKELRIKNFKRIIGAKRVDQEAQTILSMNEHHKKEFLNQKKYQRNHSSASSSIVQNTNKIKQMEATKDLVDAFKAIPPLEKLYTPIKMIIKTIRSNTSQYKTETKTLKKVLSLIASVIDSKIKAIEKQNDKFSLMNIDHYFYEYMNNRFGLEALAKKYCEIYLLSFQKYKDQDSRVELFRKFVGLDRDRLPYSVFLYYVQLIKMANYSINALFTSNIQNLYIEFNVAKNNLSAVLQNANPYIHNLIQTQLRKYAKVFSDNKRLNQGIDIEEYQTFKEFHEKLQSSKFKTINDFLQPLFNNSSYINSDQLKDYIIKKLDFQSSENADIRIANMINLFIIEALDIKPNQIGRDHIFQSMRMKFEMKVPVSAFFHIGLNAVIEHENNENSWMETLYQFYSSIEVDHIQIELGYHLRNVNNIQGMDFEQFVYFIQDTEAKIPQSQIIEIYRTTCESNYRIKMACDDFIEAANKYQLLPNRKALEVNKRKREKKLKKMAGQEDQASESSMKHGDSSNHHSPDERHATHNKNDSSFSRRATKIYNNQITMKSGQSKHDSKGISTMKHSQQPSHNLYVGGISPIGQQVHIQSPKSNVMRLKSADGRIRPEDEEEEEVKDIIEISDHTPGGNNPFRTLNNGSQHQTPMYSSLIDDTHNKFSMMGGRPDATYYTQKQGQAASSDKKKNYNIHTSLSKISLEMVSRDEDLDKEIEVTDPLDNFEMQDIKILETPGDDVSLLTDRLSSEADQHNQPSITHLPSKPDVHYQHLELEPILEEKYAKSETIQSKDSSQRTSQVNPAKPLPNPAVNHQSHYSVDVKKPPRKKDQGSDHPTEKKKITSHIDIAQQNVNERRQMLSQQENILKEGEYLKNWNEKDNQIQMFAGRNLQGDQLYNTQYSLDKSHDSTLDQVLNRGDSPARFSQNFQQAIPHQTPQKDDFNINKALLKIEINSAEGGIFSHPSGSQRLVNDFTISEKESHFEHSPLISQKKFIGQKTISEKMPTGQSYDNKESLAYSEGSKDDSGNN